MAAPACLAIGSRRSIRNPIDGKAYPVRDRRPAPQLLCVKRLTHAVQDVPSAVTSLHAAWQILLRSEGDADP